MQNYSNPYASPYSVSAQSVDVRAEFIKKTYTHLAGAIAAFAILEYLLFQIPGIEGTVFGLLQGKFSWLIVLGVFMGVSMLADKWARSNTSKGMQYMGLGLYIVAESLIFLPLLLIASMYAGANIIFNAGIITVAMTVGISVVAFTTKKDFSFLGGFLKIGGFIALGAIVLSIFMGFELGILFSAIMVLFASASILYTTSNIIHHYNTNQYVAASLSLFASVALLFWYVIRILMAFAGDE